MARYWGSKVWYSITIIIIKSEKWRGEKEKRGLGIEEFPWMKTKMCSVNLVRDKSDWLPYSSDLFLQNLSIIRPPVKKLWLPKVWPRGQFRQNLEFQKAIEALFLTYQHNINWYTLTKRILVYFHLATCFVKLTRLLGHTVYDGRNLTDKWSKCS